MKRRRGNRRDEELESPLPPCTGPRVEPAINPPAEDGRKEGNGWGGSGIEFRF